MQLFQTLAQEGHEQVVYFNFKDAGLRAIVAIHNTTLGPALGGLRMWPYASEDEALKDVLRLSKGMTYKAAVAGLNLGGGKAVLIGDPETHKSEALFRALGRFIDSLGGRYITAEDVGTTVDDMEFVLMETDRVVGVHPVHGGSGDPAPFTAFGTLEGIRACCERRFGHDSVGKLSYSVQGVGSVGARLVELLRERGAKVFVTDINADRVQSVVERFGAEPVSMDEIYDVNCDVFAPCALGGVIDEATVPRLRCKIVAGSANNQLQSDEWGTALEKRQILYAPDFAINAGGLINVALELQGYNRDRAYQQVRSIYNTVKNIFRIAERDNISSWQAAYRLGDERIAAVAKTRMPYTKQFKNRLSGRVPSRPSQG